jgi:hypothetical protein
VADFNGDHKLELVAANGQFSAGASIFLGNGDGTFQPGTYYSSSREILYVAVGDFNRGQTDFVLANYNSKNVIVSLKTGVVSFSPTTPLNFKTQPVGTTSEPQTVTMTNTSTKPLARSSIKVQGQVKMASSCGKSLAAGASSSIKVVFSPVSAGPKSGLISITDSASSKPQVIDLTRSGKAN